MYFYSHQLYSKNLFNGSSFTHQDNVTRNQKNNITQLIQVNNSVVHYNANNIASDAVFLITDRENSNNFQTVSRNTTFNLLTLDIILGLEKKLRSFKTKKDLSEVLSKYEFVSGDITRNPQFIPPTHSINESAPEFKLCIDDILRRIKNMSPVVYSNEAMRREYISTILHTANLVQCRSACDMN
ncbi:unnamed protein product [Rhizophagus irregularis]|uniref:Uncharacterized protein n=1 Tax=Rhizophagus irregularis TaxID=588596 RepID=A0A915ZRL0_9GLOM|nr:unnamed protein product [Rhizophagus irregularis]